MARKKTTSDTHQDPDGTGEIVLEGSVFRRVHNSGPQAALVPEEKAPEATKIENTLPADLFTKVIEHIEQLFCNQDFEEMELDIVAQELHLSESEKNKVKQYFGSGINACHVFVDGIFREIFNELTHSLIREDSPVNKLTALAHTHAHRIIAHTAFFQTIHDILVRDDVRYKTPSSLIERIDTNHHKSRRLIATLIAEGQMSGELRQGDPALFTHSLFATMYGIISHTHFGHQTVGTGIYNEDAVLEALTCQLRGLILY